MLQRGLLGIWLGLGIERYGRNPMKLVLLMVMIMTIANMVKAEINSPHTLSLNLLDERQKRLNRYTQVPSS